MIQLFLVCYVVMLAVSACELPMMFVFAVSKSICFQFQNFIFISNIGE